MSEGITEVEVFIEQIDSPKIEEGYVCHVMIFLFKYSFVIFLLFIHSFILFIRSFIHSFIHLFYLFIHEVIRLDKTCRICAIIFTTFFNKNTEFLSFILNDVS